MNSTLMTLEAQSSLLAPSRPTRHELTDDMVQGLAATASRSERVRSWINQGRLVLFAQPIVAAQSSQDEAGELAFEILSRLRDDRGELVLPGVFLTIAAELGLMAQIDRQVVTAVFDHFSTRPEQLARVRKCAINLSCSCTCLWKRCNKCKVEHLRQCIRVAMKKRILASWAYAEK